MASLGLTAFIHVSKIPLVSEERASHTYIEQGGKIKRAPDTFYELTIPQERILCPHTNKTKFPAGLVPPTPETSSDGNLLDLSRARA